MNDDQIIKYARKRAGNLENFISSYIAQTGLKADQILLVEKRTQDGLTIVWYCCPRAEQDKEQTGAIAHVDDEWEREANILARSFAPKIYPCVKCGKPVISGFGCTYCGETNQR